MIHLFWEIVSLGGFLTSVDLCLIAVFSTVYLAYKIFKGSGNVEE
jgi:hypothetical protein